MLEDYFKRLIVPKNALYGLGMLVLLYIIVSWYLTTYQKGSALEVYFNDKDKSKWPVALLSYAVILLSVAVQPETQ